MKEAILLLDDGTSFKGLAIGKHGTTTGEIAFNTGMTGYQEIFTDPSYFGQILVMNTAHIGNYGMDDDEVESDDVKIAGLVVKKFSQTFSRPRADQSGQEYLEENELVGISDIDTRALVRHIRDKGAMNAIISSEFMDLDELKELLVKVPSMEGLELSSKVSASKVEVHGNGGMKVALLDLGVKKNIIRCLVERGCEVTSYPMGTSAEKILLTQPDGIMLSNGPGDPSAMMETIKIVSSLVESGRPVFGICLGHQVIALSQGLRTKKMHHGHRGINHPVMNHITGKAEVTSQNHGFVVDEESLKGKTDIVITHTHLNDDSIAGIQLKSKPVFSVQYHPEANPGPHDSRYLFDQFVELMKIKKTKALTTEKH
ncbi:MAG: glutamine-hydrolyzing carbamoyl-phosphate synthase small subunit [Bacteroidetes bacterium]|jgi:carbamoyl-phosphate synthase small subunit|nr:glutamine-hydrolyzing carbamoyl-phosphate synthase small subunit [Bacteroidota bacterium]MDA0972457.1 glutamine-hydrolyzing carbamoyl-phosphate synthase small subunit [Bacteroidota bacterium]